jgi:hypothetical protein
MVRSVQEDRPAAHDDGLSQSCRWWRSPLSLVGGIGRAPRFGIPTLAIAGDVNASAKKGPPYRNAPLNKSKRKRTSWQKPANRGLLFNCVGGRLLEPILTRTAHFLVPLQRLKSLNRHPQWRVGNFGENYHAKTIHYTRCGKRPCALTTRRSRSRSVRSRRLVAGRCSEQLSTKRAAHRIRLRGHGARCNLCLLRNALVVWSALIRRREQLQ